MAQAMKKEPVNLEKHEKKPNIFGWIQKQTKHQQSGGTTEMRNLTSIAGNGNQNKDDGKDVSRSKSFGNSN